MTITSPPAATFHQESRCCLEPLFDPRKHLNCSYSNAYWAQTFAPFLEKYLKKSFDPIH